MIDFDDFRGVLKVRYWKPGTTDTLTAGLVLVIFEFSTNWRIALINLTFQTPEMVGGAY